MNIDTTEFNDKIVHLDCINNTSSHTIPFKYGSKIDMIEFRIKSTKIYYKKVKTIFDKKFILKNIHDKDNCFVTEYLCEGRSIQLVYPYEDNYIEKHYFSVIINDPVYELQNEIKDILIKLNNCLDTTIVFINQVKMSLCMYTDNKDDFNILESIATKNIFFALPKTHSYCDNDKIKYSSKSGNVTMYTESLCNTGTNSGNDCCVSIKIHADSLAIENMFNIDLNCLPIDFDTFDITKYIQFLNGDIDQITNKLFEILSNGMKIIDNDHKNSHFLNIFRLRTLKRRLFGGGYDPDYDYYYDDYGSNYDSDTDYDSDTPVAGIIGWFEIIKANYDIKHNRNYFFKKIATITFYTNDQNIGLIYFDKYNA